MKIAVTYDNGDVFQHFGKTEQFKVYEIEEGKVTFSEVISSNGTGHGALAGLLADRGINVLICGGIGGGAQMALAECGIELYGGVSGNADAAVDAYLDDNLSYDPDVKCNHHDHERSDASHACKSHGCGKGNCGNR